MRRLTGLLAMIVLAAGVLAGSAPTASACTASDGPFGAAVVCDGITVRDALHQGGLPDTATVPDPTTSDDPYRTHPDPGVWPELIFIVGLFAFEIVLRGSRPRPERPAGNPDRRRRG